MENQPNILIDNWQTCNTWDMSKALKLSAYKDECAFCDLIEQNIQTVCKNIFDAEYISHQREYQLPTNKNKKLSVDFLIKTSKDNILLECKVPKGRTQWAVSQLMKYIVVAEEKKLNVNRFVAFTTDFNAYDHKVITRFSLPVEVYFITNEKVYTVYNGN